MRKPPNTIGTTEALMRDGSVITYRDADPSHVKQQRLKLIIDAHPLKFTVIDPDGARFGVDLETGALSVPENEFEMENTPTTPLRLVYYKHMEAVIGQGAEMIYYVVGWQTTNEHGRNQRLGLKVFPGEKRFEVTEEI